VKEGYNIDFTIKYRNSFSEAETKFEEGPRKHMLKYIMLWIKILFVERIIMHMEPEKMAK
jgi:hypothetical protein